MVIFIVISGIAVLITLAITARIAERAILFSRSRALPDSVDKSFLLVSKENFDFRLFSIDIKLEAGGGVEPLNTHTPALHNYYRRASIRLRSKVHFTSKMT